jgi:Ca2+-transporting ATPase
VFTLSNDGFQLKLSTISLLLYIQITAVGMHTEWGKVMATLAVDNDEETPLQVRLNQLSENIGKIGITVAVSVFVVLVIR